MRFLKKHSRLFYRVILLLLVGAVVYILNLHFLLMHKERLVSPIVRNILMAKPLRLTAILLDNLTKKINKRSMFLEDFTFTENDMLDENGNPFHIMIWNRLGGKPGYLANTKECLGNISCQITYSNQDVKKAHAVVFPAGSSRRFPDVRHPDQLYAWWTGESPLHTSKPGDTDGLFNLTFTYKTDAGVYAPYGSINLILRELKAAGETDLEKLLIKKRNSEKVAAWAVSNCYGKRMDYAKSLMNAGLKVDTFGGCFNGRQLGNGRYSDAMYNELSHYKFYFAFENSINCKDYFTEKFWFNGLRSGAVPIVWGPKKADILKVAPTKSFIHTSDFDTPLHLVEYLQYLISNETAYAEYLEWRTWVNYPKKIEERLQLKNRENDLRSFCKLCAIVQSDARKRKLGLPSPRRIIKSVREAWLGSEKGECHS